MESARTYADSEQQNIRDLLSEIIRKRLKGVYDDALTVSGKGSIAIQRVRSLTLLRHHFQVSESFLLRAGQSSRRHSEMRRRAICRRREPNLNEAG